MAEASLAVGESSTPDSRRPVTVTPTDASVTGLGRLLQVNLIKPASMSLRLSIHTVCPYVGPIVQDTVSTGKELQQADGFDM